MGFQETIGIEIISVEKGKAVIQLEITEKVHQPFGYLHGGVSVALAEHAASIGAANSIEADEIVFGLEINANHLASKQAGLVTATAEAVHLGKSTQVWEINITDENDRLICISRCTIAVKKKRK
ncbi:1,4-dihydroxy-2-naphthoyl-CoA thioesterase MenI [Listeria swaminathanii]|uniref:1,4-dihydroxy-2-naphthoyl-CoA thioesterase MenI n=2 Tax=Listeria TaxID=1637 RepID=A0A7X1DPB7_9LIST|nr:MULTISPECIES: 1,4-dihydroxy-2-naphthoyl-CoA thioesterase MenI [Listeria]EFR86841.1 ComA operon protein 2 [Listeria marthii FSL S4-120]MBC1999371.1 PaaI family thioesterase [Listeria marthii]MBC2001923.1 PaaI family thioesterase [Listeria marthii]MBC2074874.1 PaaI family thioesterase [Listeria marthii]MBC2120958.1 PaaI family thioesterase [Listeria marthii]